MTTPPAARPIVFYLNEGSGSARECLPVIQSSVQRLSDAGQPVSLDKIDPGDFDALEQKLPEQPSLVIACGGDGTIRGFAQAIVGSGHTLGVLPLGTANMFARSLGLSMDVAEAIQQLVDGRDRWIDAAQVNDTLFLNSFVLGLYPRLAALREERRAAHAHWPKILRWVVDSFASAMVVLANWRRLHFVLEVDGEYLVGKTVTFAVTNNEKGIPPGPSALDRGELVAYIPQPVTRLGMITLFVRGIFSTPEALEPLRVVRAKKISVHVVDGTPMSVDGEADTVEGSLDLHILPRHVRVRVPSEAEHP